jgi:hypothetical protein
LHERGAHRTIRAVLVMPVDARSITQRLLLTPEAHLAYLARAAVGLS